MDKQISKKFKVGVKQENNQHFACIIIPETGDIEYVTKGYNTIEEALDDVHIEIQLRHVKEGQTIEIKTMKELEDDPDFNSPDLS